jgi:hypothetical protein
MVDLQDAKASSRYTLAQVAGHMFTNSRSVDSLYRGASLGQVGFPATPMPTDPRMSSVRPGFLQRRRELLLPTTGRMRRRQLHRPPAPPTSVRGSPEQGALRAPLRRVAGGEPVARFERPVEGLELRSLAGFGHRLDPGALGLGSGDRELQRVVREAGEVCRGTLCVGMLDGA